MKGGDLKQKVRQGEKEQILLSVLSSLSVCPSPPPLLVKRLNVTFHCLIGLLGKGPVCGVVALWVGARVGVFNKICWHNINSIFPWHHIAMSTGTSCPLCVSSISAAPH